jgi:hypothetical protein
MGLINIIRDEEEVRGNGEDDERQDYGCLRITKWL